jgi:hypothetical protein
MDPSVLLLSLTGLKLAAILLAGLFGVIGLLVDFKDRAGRITTWGKTALLGTVLSTIIAATIHVLDERRRSAASEREREQTLQLLKQIRRGVHRFNDLTFAVTIHAGPSSGLLSEAVLQNSISVRNPETASLLGLLGIAEWEDIQHRRLRGALRLIVFRLGFRDPATDESLFEVSADIEPPFVLSYGAEDEAVRERHVDLIVDSTEVSRTLQRGSMTSLEDVSGKVVDFVATFGGLPDEGLRGGDVSAVDVTLYFDRRPIRLATHINKGASSDVAVGFEVPIPAAVTEGDFGVR